MQLRSTMPSSGLCRVSRQKQRVTRTSCSNDRHSFPGTFPPICPEKEEMSRKIVFGHKTLSRLHEGPLGLCIDPYLELLNEQGYSHESAEEQVRVIVGFSRWLDDNGS